MSYNSETARGSTFHPDFTPAYKEKAGGTVAAHRLVDIATDGDVEQSAANSANVVGVLHSSYNGKLDATSGQQVSVGVGRQTVVADIAPIVAGQALKAAGAGRVTSFVDAALSGDTIEDNVGLGFTNQPTNDGVEVVSASASDITQTVTIYYTRTGTPDTVNVETKTLNGTTQVSFTDTDIDQVLAVEKSAATVGTVTFREASGNATITTLIAATLSAGKIAVTAAQVYAYNTVPVATVDGVSIKQVGLIGTNSTGTTIYDSQLMTGTSPATFNTAFRTVTFLLVGDLETARTVTVMIGAEDSPARNIGFALGASTAVDTLIDAFITPNHADSTLRSSTVRTGQEYQLSASPKIGATAGWVVAGTTNLGEFATLPASQTGSTLVLRVIGLKVGWTVTGFKVEAQIESAGGAVTLDCDLRKLTNTAADPVDASIGAITQVSVTADTKSEATKTGLSEVITADAWLYLLITATTAASTDIRLLGVTVTVTES